MTRSLLLVRHGQIEANARGRWHGATDSPLTRIGRRQVARIAQRISRDWGDAEAIYSSPMIRCLHTAQAIGSALDQPVMLDDDLREYGIGELEDTTFAALQSEHDFFRRIRDKHRFRAARRRLDQHRSQAHRPGACGAFMQSGDSTRPIVVVSHGAALAIALAALLDADANHWTNYQIDNCSVTELLLEPEPLVAAFNSTEHL